MVEKDLLRRAWPDGFLPMRGVGTLGGWIFSSYCCIFSEYGFHQRQISPRTSVVVHAPGANNHIVQEWIDEGDLLPVVDPVADPATWACLLHDLALAIFKVSGVKPDLAPGGLLWRPHRGDRWILEEPNGTVGHVMIGERTEDPARALVLARIQLQEGVS